jgi:hypothetical protein
MPKTTQTHESPYYSSPDYHYPSDTEQRKPESLFSKFMDKTRDLRDKMRDKKVGRKAVAGVLMAGAAWGTVEAVSASNESDRQEAVAVGEQFKDAIQPAAKNLADAAKTGYYKSKNDGYLLESSNDPSKYNLSFHHTFKDGSSYKITAVVGENDKGEADTSKVERAEIIQESVDDLQTSVLTFELDDDVMNGEQQWVASSGLVTKGMDTLGVTTKYFGGAYEDKDQSLELAKKQAKEASDDLTEIAKKTASDNEQTAA